MPLPTQEEARQLLEQHVGDDYQRYHARMVATALEGQTQTFVVEIDAHARGRGVQPYRIRAFDGSGFLTLAWFKGAGPAFLEPLPTPE